VGGAAFGSEPPTFTTLSSPRALCCLCSACAVCCAALCCGAEAHNNLGVLQRDVGAIPDALASYERALQLVPDSRNAGGVLVGDSGGYRVIWG